MLILTKGYEGSIRPILPYQKTPEYFQVFLLHSFLPKTLATFQPGHAPALRHSALTSPGVLPQSLKLQLSSEDVHSCNRFSNLISNVLGLIHLPIIYVHQAILEHQLILIDASLVVLRRWWPLLTQPNRKQGQLVVMSMPLARHNPIRVRSAKLWPTIASTMKTGTSRASSCFFTDFMYSMFLSRQPHEGLDILTMTDLLKAPLIPQNHT